MICELVEDGFTLYDAFYIVCKGIGGPDGAKALETIFKTTKSEDDGEDSEDDE